MNIISLLETLATHTRFEFTLDELLSTQPDEVKKLFLTNNSALLKPMFPHADISADRTTILQL